MFNGSEQNVSPGESTNASESLVTLQHAEQSSHGLGVPVRLDVDPFSASSLRVAPDAEVQEDSNDPRQEEVILYPGDGTKESPYVVDWDEDDTQNPYNWSKTRKWPLTALLASGTFCVSFASSSYSGGLSLIAQDFHVPREIAVLGVSLYVLGFGLGPLLFAPLSEMYGRRIVFICTYAPFTLLHMGGALAKNTTTLLISRMLAGTFGSSPLTNAGGAISDMWVARERGVAVSLYSTAPFLGPVLGPIVGGFTAESKLGWRFNFWIMMMFAGLVFILNTFFLPETYGPVLLRRKARRLQKEAQGKKYYVSKFDVTRQRSLLRALRLNLTRPFVFLFREPIVTAISVYVGIAYATLYALFAAFPIVFEEHRNFTPGQSGLAFLGIGLGIIFGTCLTPIQNRIYWREMDRSPTGKAPPEARLYSAMLGGVLLPISLFWFAWTADPPVSFFSPIFAGTPFGLGIATIMQSLTAYMMDSYGIFAASAIAASVLLRSIMACAFPLFSPFMFGSLGDHWAMSIFGFCAVACMPLPLLFYKYGPFIRSRSKFAVKEEQRPPMTPHASPRATFNLSTKGSYSDKATNGFAKTKTERKESV